MGELQYKGIGAIAMENKYFRRGFGLKEEVAEHLVGDYHSAIVDYLKSVDYSITIGATTVKLAQEFGFCYGVDRSIEYAYQTVERFPDKNIYLIGEIIHNPFVNNKLTAMGIRILAMDKVLDMVKPEDVVILPAFGISITLLAALKERGCILVDTTCGSVLNVWKHVEKFTQEGYTALVHGKYYHEETIATVSRTTSQAGGKYLVVRDKKETDMVCDYIVEPANKEAFIAYFAKSISTGFDPDTDLVKIGVANQTTMLARESMEIGRQIKQALIKRYGREAIEDHFRSFDTICSATQDRQDAIIKLLKEKADVAIVIGGFNSSNTNNLTNIAAAYGPAYHIEDADCILSVQLIKHKPAGQEQLSQTSGWLPEKPLTIAITAGASTPNTKIGEVIEKIFKLRGETNILEILYGSETAG
jgi:4-hydroxy-3-methylbut-2-enyl diphosphate reductase